MCILWIQLARFLEIIDPIKTLIAYTWLYKLYIRTCTIIILYVPISEILSEPPESEEAEYVEGKLL